MITEFLEYKIEHGYILVMCCVEFQRVLNLLLLFYYSTGIEFKGGFSFSIGSYKEKTLAKPLSVASIRTRFVDHPCHGCLCFPPPSAYDNRGWDKVTRKGAFPVFALFFEN